MVTPDWLIIERGITMTRQDIETREHDRTEVAIRRWLIAQNVWAPEVLQDHPLLTDAVQPAAKEARPPRTERAQPDQEP